MLGVLLIAVELVSKTSSQWKIEERTNPRDGTFFWSLHCGRGPEVDRCGFQWC